MTNFEIKNLLSASESWDVKVALAILRGLKQDHKLVVWRQFRLTPVDVAHTCATRSKAKDIQHIQFASGLDSTLYTGSLAMYVVDKILTSWKEEEGESPIDRALHRSECSNNGERIVDYIRIEDAIIPILESGRQGRVV